VLSSGRSTGLSEQVRGVPGETPTTLLPTDELVLNRLTWLTAMYGTRSRISEFTLDLLTLPQATVQAALALEIGDRVTISSPAEPVALVDRRPDRRGHHRGAEASVEQAEVELTFNTVPAALFRPGSSATPPTASWALPPGSTTEGRGE
jgi:hypothetical protein